MEEAPSKMSKMALDALSKPFDLKEAVEANRSSLQRTRLNETNTRINIVDELPKEPRFKKAGPKGQYDRRIILSERGEGRIREYHATKGWRSYRAA